MNNKQEASIELNYNKLQKWKMLIQQAKKYKKTKDYQKASLYYNRALKIYPDDSDTINDKGLLLLDNEQYSKAFVYFDKATNLDKENIEAWNNKGLTCYYQEKYKKAIDCFKRSLLLDKLNEDAWHFLGHCYQYLERYRDARKCFEKLTTYYSRDSHYWAELGNSLLNASGYKDAIKFFEKSIKIDSHDVQALAGKGGALYAMKNYSKAILFLKKSLKIDPRDGYSLHYLGHCYQELKNYPEAIKCFEKEISIAEDKYDDTYFVLGTSYFEQKNYTKAIATFRKSVEKDDISIRKSALRKISNIYNLLKKHREARKYRFKAQQIKFKSSIDSGSKKRGIEGASKPGDKPKILPKPFNTKNVFIIHGHDSITLSTITKFLRKKFGIRAMLLSEQPGASMTIIEKFEKIAKKANFAIALFTPDDEGKAKDQKNLQPRPRQNVIFELGYFFAKLKRDKTCVITKIRNVDSEFSDYRGVLEIRMEENDEWKHKLENELRTAKIV